MVWKRIYGFESRRQLQKGPCIVLNTFMIIVAIFMAMTVIPHILRMIKTGASRDQSFLGVCGVAIGIVCWIGYGVVASDPTIVVANIIMLSTYLAYLTTVVYYRIRNGDVTRGPDGGPAS